MPKEGSDAGMTPLPPLGLKDLKNKDVQQVAY